MGFLIGAGLLLLALIWWFLRRLYNQRPKPAVTPPAPPQPEPVVAPVFGMASRIEEIEEKFLKNRAFREGCHVLAMAAKSHLGREHSHWPIERMTSTEIAIAIKDERVGRFMTDLAHRRYGREEPRRAHFVKACAEARELLA